MHEMVWEAAADALDIEDDTFLFEISWPVAVFPDKKAKAPYKYLDGFACPTAKEAAFVLRGVANDTIDPYMRKELRWTGP